MNHDALFCADNHFRDDTPVCRVDDFYDVQFQKLAFITELARGCPVLCAGDLLDYWKVSHALEGRLIRELPRPWVTVPGQHELPSHRMAWLERSALNVLGNAGAVEILRVGYVSSFDWGTVYGAGWGEDPRGIKVRPGPGRHILLWHRMVWSKAPPFPGVDPEGEAFRLLKSLPQFDGIVTGDNHQTFEVEDRGRWLINPGPMTRQRSVEKSITPGVYTYRAKDNSWTRVSLPTSPEAISVEHLKRRRARPGLGVFAEKLLASTDDPGLDFEHNLRVYLAQNPQSKKVEELIWQLTEE